MFRQWKVVVCLGAYLVLSACSMPRIMTQERFDSVQIGASIAQVEELYGSPYDVEMLGNGRKEYRYIERIDVAPGVTEQVHYILQVTDGRVINKHVRHIGSPIDVRSP